MPRSAPPGPLLVFVADQIETLPDCIGEYLVTDRNRQRHAIECQEQLGLRPFGKLAAAEVTEALLVQAIENDRLSFLAEAVMQVCRARGIVVPSPAALERLCADLRHGARREAHRRLAGRLSAEQRKRLDALTEHREGSSLSWLAWLQQMPEAARPSAMTAYESKNRRAGICHASPRCRFTAECGNRDSPATVRDVPSDRNRLIDDRP